MITLFSHNGVSYMDSNIPAHISFFLYLNLSLLFSYFQCSNQAFCQATTYEYWLDSKARKLT